MTIQVSALALVLGLLVSSLLVICRLSGNIILNSLALFYVSIFRGTPLLVQLFILYFGGPQVGLDLSPFTAGVIGLGINIGSYMSESMRGAFVSVDNGQKEAARSIGFCRIKTMLFIILPQAARLMIRPLGVNAIALVKGSALVSTISVVELTYTAQRFIGSTYKPFEIFSIAAILYLIIIMSIKSIVNFLEKSFAFS